MLGTVITVPNMIIVIFINRCVGVFMMVSTGLKENRESGRGFQCHYIRERFPSRSTEG